MCYRLYRVTYCASGFLSGDQQNLAQVQDKAQVHAASQEATPQSPSLHCIRGLAA